MEILGNSIVNYDKDSEHHLFPRYMRYRNSCSSQLIRSPSFNEWLNGERIEVERNTMLQHPKYKAFVSYLRECNSKNKKSFDFWKWLENFK